MNRNWAVLYSFGILQISPSKSKKRKNTRKRHFCPFPQCHSYLKLSQHIQDQHKEIGDKERHEMCKKAPVAPDKCARKSVPGQRQIASFFSMQGTDSLSTSQREVMNSESPGLGEENSPKDNQEGDKEPYFPSEHPFLVQLRNYLQSRHGRSRSEKEAKQISKEVSKYLHYASPSILQKELLLDCSLLNKYLQSLEPEYQASTQNAKLNRIRQAIHFLALSLDAAGLLEVQRVESLVKNWSAVFAKTARQANREKLEDKSEQPIDFGDVDRLVRSEELHQLQKRLITAAKNGQQLVPQDLHTVEVWLAGCLLLTNHQRPGAITNMCCDEFERAMSTKDPTSATIRVRNHKTATTGRAMVTARGVLLQSLTEYVQHLRPLLPDSPLLFPNKMGKPFDHLSRHVQQLGEKFSLQLPNATDSRHTAATATAMSCSDQDRDAVATAMSHSRKTQQNYYVNLKSKQEAARGFQVLEDLRQGHKTASKERKPRVEYSKEDVQTIALYFDSYIAAQDVPSAQECKQFLDDHPMSRSPKNVRDKVRQIIDTKRKAL